MKCFTLLFAALFIFSCYDNVTGIVPAEQLTVKSGFLSADQLAATHNEIQSQFKAEVDLDEADEEQFDNVLTKNVNALNKSGYATYIADSDISFEMEILEFMVNHSEAEGLYAAVADKYQLDATQAEIVFIGYEVYKLAVDNYRNSEDSYQKVDGVSCGLAVAGTILTTLGAATVTTGWGLGIWIAGKVVATASVAYGCS